MPSFRALLLSPAVAVLALVQLAAATPLPDVAAADWWPPVPTTPTLPLSGDPTELPAPPAGQSVQYVALGRGVQNYTCASATAVPVALGAVATLFDGTALVRTSEEAFNHLPPLAVYLPLSALSAPMLSLPVLGHHFFGADGTPTFDLSRKGKILYGKKTADILAPADASKGPAGTGAVDWLQLVAKPGFPSVGLQTVYRVVTAGGDPPAACPREGVVSVQYAAEYWFFD